MADEEIGARLKLKDRKQFSDDADKAAKSVKNIGDETDKADRKMRSSGGSSGGTSILRSGLGGLMSVARLGAIAIAGLGAAVGVASVKFLSLASDAAESASAFNTVFGPATTQVQGFVDTMNQDFGIPTAQLQDAARQFGVFAKAADLPTDAIAGFSTSLTQAGLDLGSFYNSDPTEVFAALQSGLSGEAEPLRKFGIFLSDASLGAFALSKGISKSVTEMTDQEKVALRQQFILANLGDAQGDLARTSGGLANQWRALKGRLVEAGTAIGTSLLPWATKAVNYLNDKFAPIVKSLTETAPLFGQAFTDAFNGGRISDGPMSLLGIAERLGATFGWLKGLWDDLTGAFQDGGIYGVTAELDDMVGAGGLLSGTLDTLISIASSLFDIWKDLVLPVLKQFNKILPRSLSLLGLVADVLEWVAENGETLQPILAAVLAGFIAFKVVTGIIKAITAAQMLWNAAMAMNPIGLVVIAIAALAAGLIYAWNNSETFRRVVTSGFNAVKDAVMAVWHWISDNWPLLLAILTGPIGLAVLAIVRNWDTIKDAVTGVKDWIVEKWNMIIDFITGLPDRIYIAALGMFDGLKEAFKSAINWIIRAWNGLDFSVPSIDLPGIGSVGGFTLGVPDIDELHTGGTTTSAGLVNIRPDEEIIFLPPSASVVPMSDNVNSMAAAFSGSPGQQQGPIVMQVVLDRKVIAEAVYDHAGDQAARR